MWHLVKTGDRKTYTFSLFLPGINQTDSLTLSLSFRCATYTRYISPLDMMLWLSVSCNLNYVICMLMNLFLKRNSQRIKRTLLNYTFDYSMKHPTLNLSNWSMNRLIKCFSDQSFIYSNVLSPSRYNTEYYKKSIFQYFFGTLSHLP